ncbi:MAG: NAD(P)-dependent oxidoreductase [Chloroflexi bacterium]|nr:NAD(P)-dependent oxidoreductase [Chloroflexota bacterium]MBV6436692.1 Aurachin B dehydrogenase [Anaerolineae bacterium]
MDRSMPSLPNTSVLVTGASGFVGGHLTRTLAERGVQVKALARVRERAKYIDGLDRVEIVLGDLTDADSLRRAVEGCSVVFHVAAATHGPLTAQQAVNADGTRALAQIAADAGVQRVVHVSSVAIYGFKNLPERVDEDMPPIPSPYAYTRTKLAGEHALREVANARGMEYSIVRPGMIYGPRSGLWTAQVFRLAAAPVTVFLGSGEGYAIPIHVDDVCSLLIACAEHPAAAGEAFNCAPDPGVPWRAWLSAYRQLKGPVRWLGIPPLPVRLLAPLIAALSPRDSLGHDFPAVVESYLQRITYSTAKAQRLLGWSPQHTLESGVQSCVPYLKRIGRL